jgi:hypothetical protein
VDLFAGAHRLNQRPSSLFVTRMSLCKARA